MAQLERRPRDLPSAQPKLSPLRRFELRMHALCTAARLLPALTAENAASERARLVAELERDGALVPRWQLASRRVPTAAFRLLDALRGEAAELPGASLYSQKLEELELDLLILDALGKPRLVRPLSARRFGTGTTLVPTASGPKPLWRCARAILDRIPPRSEPRDVPPDGDSVSLCSLVRGLAREVGLEVRVQVEPRLSAGAATGERTVFVAARSFGRHEALRLAVHEVLGHLLVASNARAQPLQLLQWGTAGSFADQEGLALYMEEAAGVLDGARLRTLGGRVLAADMMHAGASFAEAATKLKREQGFSALDAIALCERAYRGGGVARDTSYLLGWLRVHAALRAGEADIDELRAGRVGLDALPALRELRAEGYVRRPRLRPDFTNLARSFFSTKSGTTLRKSPPSDAASLIRLELTKK